MYDSLTVEQRDTNDTKPGQLRRSGWIPGVIFAKDMSSLSLKFRESEFRKILGHGVKVFEVELEGQGTHLVNLESVQRDPATNRVLHVSFHRLNKNQKVTVSVPVKLSGTALGSKEGGLTRLLLDEVTISGLPHKIPEFIEVSVDSLELNGHINIGDVNLPSGLEFNESDFEKGLVNCTVPKVVDSATEDASAEASEEVAAASEESVEELKEAA